MASKHDVVRFVKPVPWTDGIVPVVISASFNVLELDWIYHCMEDFMCELKKNTTAGSRFPIVFVPLKSAPDMPYLFIEKTQGTSNATTGNLPGSVLSLDMRNTRSEVGRIFKHEMLHVLGFFHEHQRMDRDCHIKIREDISIEDWNVNYVKIHPDSYVHPVLPHLPYDIRSIMHYGCKNITPIDPAVLLRWNFTLSALDVYKVWLVYPPKHTGSQLEAFLMAFEEECGCP